MAKKRIQRRADGRFAVQIYLGLGDDGKRKYKTVYGSTQKEVESKAIDLRIQLRKGIDLIADNDLFREWSTVWLKSKDGNVSSQYFKGLCGKVNHLNERIGNFAITKLRTADLQEIIDELSSFHPATGRPAAKKTLVDFKGVLEQVCELAIENRVMDFNPARYIRIPAKAPQSHRRALTAIEQQWIIDTPHRAQRSAMIMMYAGLRRGELIPLQWSDIDLDARTLSVTKSVEIIGGKSVVKPGGKTECSYRVIDIPQRLCDYLTAEKAKVNPSPFSLVCPSSSGVLMTESGFRRMWESYLVDLNFKYGNRMDKRGKIANSKQNPNGLIMTIPHFTAHWLRHTYATMLYLSGVDVLTAKEQLGHSDIKTTLSIYTHLDSVYKRRSMDKLDSYLAEQFSQEA